VLVSVWMMLGGILLVSMIGVAAVIWEWRRQSKNNGKNEDKPVEEEKQPGETGSTHTTMHTRIWG
jgi:hypothetical protein